MFSYFMLGTNDLPRAITFYEPLMEMPGYLRGGRNEYVAWWGVFNCNNMPALSIGRPFDKQDDTIGNGLMVALISCSTEHIKQLHALAVSHGGTDEKAPALLYEKLVDVAFITTYTGMTDKWFYKLIKDGLFPKPIKLGRSSRWKKSEVELWLQQRITDSRGQ